jgi:hypothetical protein
MVAAISAPFRCVPGTYAAPSSRAPFDVPAVTCACIVPSPAMTSSASTPSITTRTSMRRLMHRFAKPMNGKDVTKPCTRAIRRRSATFVTKILTGAKPGNPRIEQPTTFELVINLNAANE